MRPAVDHNPDDPRGSFKEAVRNMRSWGSYLRSKWRFLLVAALLSAFIALAYACLSKPKYISTCSFVLDDNENNSLSSYAGLAALAGVSVNTESNGIFSGDNILELYRSQTMLKQTLLTPCDFDGKKTLLIDRYIAFSHFDTGTENVRFDPDTSKTGRLQDSVIFEVVKKIRKNNLGVAKRDRKLSIIDVQVISKDEMFSLRFNQALVQNVNRFYVRTRSAHAMKNLLILQQQTDSVRKALSGYIAGAALANDIVPNANPERSVLHTGSQKKAVDIQAGSGVYAELIKNLELAKITLRKETPLIQLIDSPALPLEKEQPGKTAYTLAGFFMGLTIAVFGLVLKKGFALSDHRSHAR